MEVELTLVLVVEVEVIKLTPHLQLLHKHIRLPLEQEAQVHIHTALVTELLVEMVQILPFQQSLEPVVGGVVLILQVRQQGKDKMVVQVVVVEQQNQAILT